MNKLNRILRVALIGLVLPAGLALAQDSNYEFGVTPFFKNYPEFKRGFDPYANLSGSLRESVDLYSGKLNVSFQLPGIPWSEKTSFAPVLLYNSNIWSYCTPSAMKFDVGGVLSKSAPPPPETQRLDIKIPDYWGNDAWLRFSPIGQPHAMPGWSLPVGGLYTEYQNAAAPIDVVGYPPACLTAMMQKKYFIAPDGSSHLLVEMETANRPYFAHYNDPTTPCTVQCEPYPGGGLTTICLPRRYATGGASRIWHAVDGSFYYYVESQNKVYAKDGASYTLDAATGMITAMTDPGGNTIAVAWADAGGQKLLSYTGPTGAVIRVYFNKAVLPNFNPNGGQEDIDILLLQRVEAPTVNNGTMTWTIQTTDLATHLSVSALTFRDLFFGTVINHCPPIADGTDIGDRVFCKQAAPDLNNKDRNSQIFLPVSIILPDGSTFQFQYNHAGKLCRVVYPDGGSRRYDYANTVDPSIGPDSCMAFGWPGLLVGEAPLGGVGLVWQDAGGGDALERAYAYTGFTTADYVQTLTWLGDRSVQLHQYYPGENMLYYREILQFGLPKWTTAKLRFMRQYDFTDKTGAEDQFRDYFLRVRTDTDPGDPYYGQKIPAIYSFATVRDYILIKAGGAAVAPLQEEETVYQNYDAGWHWALPTAYCTTSGCTPYALADFYRTVIPSAPDTWSSGNFLLMSMPEWNTVATQTITRVYEKQTTPLTKKTVYTWSDITCPGGVERQAALTKEDEYSFASSTTVYRSRTHTFFQYWPATPVAGLPARVLGLPLETDVKVGTTMKAGTKFNYRTTDPALVNARKDFFPTQKQDWKSGTLWTRTDFGYNSAPVRLTSAAAFDWVSSAFALFNTTKYYYDSYGLLSRVEGWKANASSYTLYMCLNYDRYTGLLLKRMDRNGDRNSNLAFDAAGDDYIFFAYDGYTRLTDVKLRHLNADKWLTHYAYQTGPPYQITATTYQDANSATNAKVTTTWNDPLDRPAYTWTTLGTKGGTAKESFVQKEFDVLGRAAVDYFPQEVDAGGIRTIPSPEENEANHGKTVHVYDAMGREIQTVNPTPDGAGECSRNASFTLNTTLKCTVEQASDEAGRYRKLYRDAFGRIARVDEQNPAGAGADWITRYTYDVLDNLTQVDKRNAGDTGGQARNFVYDALSRLTRAQLPEYAANFMHYTYDDLGDLKTRSLKNASGVAQGYDESLTYDSFCRPLTRATTFKYDGTNNFTVNDLYEYDAVPASPPSGMFASPTYLYGKLTHDKVTYPALAGGATVERFFDYEWHGNAAHKGDKFAGLTPFITTYAWFDQAGGLQQVTYPSGQIVANTYAPGGVTGRISLAGAALFDTLAYAAHGPVEAMTLKSGSNAVNWAETFNARLWPATVVTGPGVTRDTAVDDPSVLLGLEYPASQYENNGNIKQVNRYYRQTAGTTLGTFTFNYGYDYLNRLSSANFTLTPPPGSATNGSYTYNVDEFGNVIARTKVSGSANAPATLTLAADRTTNRLSGQTYDVLGNLKSVATNTFLYQDQGHVLDLKNSSGLLLYRYLYDAEGKRRIKAKANTSGVIASLTNDCTYYFYEGEDLICQQDRGTQVSTAPGFYDSKFLLQDHLGTTRAELKFNGSTPTIVQAYDLMPYGEIIGVTTPTSEQKIFTGKQRDTESGLDFFGARYYSNNLCRWISTDQPLIDNQIETAWKGSYKQDGITFTVATTVDIQVFGSENEAKESAAQNVVEATEGSADSGAESFVSTRLRAAAAGYLSQDVGIWRNDTASAGHEFGHLLGVGHLPGSADLMSTGYTSYPQKASTTDFMATFGSLIADHLEDRSSHSSTLDVRVPWF